MSVDDRRAWVLQEYLKGVTPALVYKSWSERFTGLTKASFDMDVVKAYEALREHAERNSEVVIDKHYAYLNDMYREAREAGKLDIAVKILREIRETLSIGGVKKSSTGITVNQYQQNLKLPDMSVDEIKQLLGQTSTGATPQIIPISSTNSNE